MGYRFTALLQKFWARSWFERRIYMSRVLRGVLRAWQNDSPHLVLMGGGVLIDKRYGRLTTGGVCEIGEGCRIAIVGKADQPARLHIGEGSTIGDRTIVNVSQRVEIGNRCSISWNCNITDSDFHQVILAGGQMPPISAAVIVEDDVWVGSHVLIFKGVTVGHHSVISAGSVVRNSVPPYSLVAGNPARRVGQVEGWKR